MAAIHDTVASRTQKSILQTTDVMKHITENLQKMLEDATKSSEAKCRLVVYSSLTANSAESYRLYKADQKMGIDDVSRWRVLNCRHEAHFAGWKIATQYE